MPGWMWRWRKRGRGRPFSPLFLPFLPSFKEFIPNPCLDSRPVELTFPEYNALVLIDFEGLTQEEAARRMGTSRGTVWRLVENARKKVSTALKESRPLVISLQGEVEKIK